MTIILSFLFLSVLAAPYPARLLFPARESQICSQYSLDYESSTYLVTDPDNCQKFYSCQRKYDGAFRTNRKELKWIWIAYRMDCPLGTFFDGFSCKDGPGCQQERTWIFSSTVKPGSSFMEKVKHATPQNSTYKPSHSPHAKSSVLQTEASTLGNKTFPTSSIDENSSKLIFKTKEIGKTMTIWKEKGLSETSIISNDDITLLFNFIQNENETFAVENISSPDVNSVYSNVNTISANENTTSPIEITTSPYENTTSTNENTLFPSENTTNKNNSFSNENTSYLNENTFSPNESALSPNENTLSSNEITTSESEKNTAFPNEKITFPNEITTFPNEITTYPDEITTFPNENIENTPEPNAQFPIENTTMRMDVEHEMYHIDLPGRSVQFQDETTASTAEEAFTLEIAVQPEELDIEITTLPAKITRERGNQDQKFYKYIRLISGNIKYSENEPKLFEKTIRDVKTKPHQSIEIKEENEKKYPTKKSYEADGLDSSFEKYIKLVSSKIYQSR